MNSKNPTDFPDQNHDPLIEKVKKELTGHPGLEGADFFVSLIDGAIVLKGVVDTKAERDKAVEIARQVPGVSAVNEELRIMADNLPTDELQAGFKGPDSMPGNYRLETGSNCVGDMNDTCPSSGCTSGKAASGNQAQETRSSAQGMSGNGQQASGNDGRSSKGQAFSGQTGDMQGMAAAAQGAGGNAQRGSMGEAQSRSGHVCSAPNKDMQSSGMGMKDGQHGDAHGRNMQQAGAQDKNAQQSGQPQGAQGWDGQDRTAQTQGTQNRDAARQGNVAFKSTPGSKGGSSTPNCGC